MLTFGAMTRLDNSYCVPITDEEWAAIDALNPRIELRIKGKFVYTLKEHGKRRLWLCHRKKGNAKEIPVSRFLDMWHDRIVQWRLQEVGFVHSVRGIYELNVNPHGHFTLEYCEGFVYVSAGRTSITTFTELLELIRMLTPPSNG